jgi:hypothetical protein
MPPDAVVLVAAMCASLEPLDYLLQRLLSKIAARGFGDTGCITNELSPRTARTGAREAQS